MTARILIAEDHADSLELMAYLLSSQGYETLTAENGEVALDLALRARPDLIICDLQMPRLSGYEIAQNLKRDPALQRVPLIAVTAFSMLGDREFVLAAGFDGYFSKPIQVATFVSELERHLPPGLRAAQQRVDGKVPR